MDLPHAAEPRAPIMGVRRAYKRLGTLSIRELLIIFYFLLGLGAGWLLGFLWEVHRVSKLILLALSVLAVGFTLFNFSEFAASFNVWPLQLSQFVGIILGDTAGKRMGKGVKTIE